MPNNDEEVLIALRERLTQMHESFAMLKQERDVALQAHQRLQGEVRLLTVERDLLKERLRASIRKLFAAKSEARGSAQSDLFFNEAEALATPSTTVAEEAPADPVQVPAHRRLKPGRKPLDAALPRKVIRHELPIPSGCVPTTEPRCKKSAWRRANNWTHPAENPRDPPRSGQAGRSSSPRRGCGSSPRGY